MSELIVCFVDIAEQNSSIAWEYRIKIIVDNLGA